MNRRVYLPVEIKAREWHARILLAGACVERGFEVVLGEQKEIIERYQDGVPGIWLFKGAGKRSADRFRRMGEAGHRVTCLCEEGLVFLDRRTYQARKVHPETLQYVDRFFAWGREHAETVLEKAPELEPRMSIAGNPRFDLLRTELREVIRAEQKYIEERYGRFVLINSNFAMANHFHGCEWQLELLLKRGMLEKQDEEKTFWEQVEFQNALMREFAKLASEISERYPDVNVVVRPHPSEDGDTWRRMFNDGENIHVVYEDAVLPWLSAAEMMVHNGCTTAVEAYVMGKDPVAFRPVKDERFEPAITNLVSLEANNSGDVLGLYREAREKTGREERAGQGSPLEGYVAAMDGPLSSDLIADAFLELPVSAGSARSPAKSKTGSPLAYLRGIRSRVLGRGRTGSGKPAAYQNQKFPGVSNGELGGILARMGTSLSRFEDIDVAGIEGSENCFLLRPQHTPRAV